jgi:hypothetical protein
MQLIRNKLGQLVREISCGPVLACHDTAQGKDTNAWIRGGDGNGVQRMLTLPLWRREEVVSHQNNVEAFDVLPLTGARFGVHALDARVFVKGQANFIFFLWEKKKCF